MPVLDLEIMVFGRELAMKDKLYSCERGGTSYNSESNIFPRPRGRFLQHAKWEDEQVMRSRCGVIGISNSRVESTVIAGYASCLYGLSTVALIKAWNRDKLSAPYLWIKSLVTHAVQVAALEDLDND